MLISLYSLLVAAFGSPTRFLTTSVFVSVFFQILGLLCFFVYYFYRKAPIHILEQHKGKNLPGVTVIKACHRAEDNERENFDRFFNQDYAGPYQLLFVVSEENAPIVPLVRELLALYPKVDAKLVVSKTRRALWSKVDALYDGHQQAKHEFIIWSDSDVIVHSDYISQMAASLMEPGVSVVTTPQYDKGVNNFGTAIKVLANNADVAAMVMLVDFFVEYKKIAFGQSIGFNRIEFDAMGDITWNTLNRFVADDLALPHLFYMHGKKVVFRNIHCPVQYADKSVWQSISQKCRWVRVQRAAIGNGFLYWAGGIFISTPQIPATLLVLADGFSAWSLKVWLACASVRILISLVFEVLCLGSAWMTARYFWTIWMWDLLQAYYFTYGSFTNTIYFGAKSFKVVDRYFLQDEITPSESPQVMDSEPQASLDA